MHLILESANTPFNRVQLLQNAAARISFTHLPGASVRRTGHDWMDQGLSGGSEGTKPPPFAFFKNVS